MILVLVSTIGCAQVGWWGSDVGELASCPANSESCFSLREPLWFPPVIVAPGRIAVVTEEGLGPHRRPSKPSSRVRARGPDLPQQLWATEDTPTPNLAAFPMPSASEGWLRTPSPAEDWEGYCALRFADGASILTEWGHKDLSTGLLATGRTADGVTFISYYVWISTDEWYLAEVTSSRRLADRDWSSTFGDVKRPGRASLSGELHGHAARIEASATDPFKRENFFAAFMPQIKYCVGDKRGVHRDTFVFPDAAPDGTE
jgi:hypothetical protein